MTAQDERAAIAAPCEPQRHSSLWRAILGWLEKNETYANGGENAKEQA